MKKMSEEYKEDLTLHEMKYDKGGLGLKLGGQTAMTFMQALVELFEVNGGKNFLTITLNQGDNHYGITIQNHKGEDTPAEKMQRQEDEIKRYESTLSEILTVIDHYEGDVISKVYEIATNNLRNTD